MYAAGRGLGPVRAVYATSEAATAERAFERAYELLWERIAAIEGAEVRNIDHSIATRTVSEKTLNLKEWKEQIVGEISTVIVSLLATCTIPPSQSSTSGHAGQNEGHGI